MKDLWRKYSSKLRGRLHGYVEDGMLYVLAWIYGIQDSRASNHSTEIIYFTWSSYILELTLKGFRRAKYRYTAIVQTFRTATLMVIGTTAFPTNNLRIKSPVIPFSCRLTLDKAKSYCTSQDTASKSGDQPQLISREDSLLMCALKAFFALWLSR